MEDKTTVEKKDFNYYVSKLLFVLAVLMSLFHFITALVGTLPAMEQRCIHIGFAMLLIYLQTYLKAENKFVKYSSLVFFVGSLVGTVYVYDQWYSMMIRLAYPTQMDIIMGVMTVILVMEATRRKLGWALPLISLFFILYALFGNYLPPAIGHRGYTIKRLVSVLYMELSGIYGQVAGISATYIFLFVLFGAFLESSGASRFFIDLSTGLFGKNRGGSAKVCAVSSGLFGMVSGSAVANVMAVGPLTIPMMTRSGYTPRFGGAITAVAGTGGQLMPPIMGAAAFIISETIGIPYLNVALAAFIPGILYYMAIIFIIDLRSSKLGMKGLDEVPDWKAVLKKDFYMALPVILLMYFLAIAMWSPIKSGFWSIIALIVVSWVKKDTRIGVEKFFKALYAGAMGALEVAITCGLAGVMIGILSMTGLGLKFSGLLIQLSGGNLIVLLILTGVAGLILGMGMTTTSVYIILSVLVAPALTDMGVPPLAAHLYVFYFGILSAITPPVAVASFAAASVANDNAMKLGWEAWRIGLSGYILPFMFIFSPELLLNGTAPAIIQAAITSLIGIYAISVALEGFYKYRVNVAFRLLMFVAALLLIKSGTVTDLIGLGIVAFVLVPQIIKARKEKALAGQ